MCPDVTDPEAFAARVVGDSMEPDYREGEVVVFSPGLPTPSGSDCFVRLERDNETTFKRIYLENDGRTIRLQPLNGAYPPRSVDREDVSGLWAAANPGGWFAEPPILKEDPPNENLPELRDQCLESCRRPR